LEYDAEYRFAEHQGQEFPAQEAGTHFGAAFLVQESERPQNAGHVGRCARRQIPSCRYRQAGWLFSIMMGMLAVILSQ